MIKRILAVITLLSLVLLAECKNWDRLISAIMIVESNNNPKAVCGDQVGCLQIRPILVRDCNRILKRRGSSKRYSMRDRYSVRKSKEMFVLYQSYYNPKGNIDKAIRLWNGGSNYTIRGTQKYYKKVKKEMKK